MHSFEKPWFVTFESVLACWVSLLLYNPANVVHWYRRPSPPESRPGIHQPLLQVLPAQRCVITPATHFFGTSQDSRPHSQKGQATGSKKVNFSKKEEISKEAEKVQKYRNQRSWTSVVC